ncbi:magnesium transporter [Clostridium magnum]|uniref:Magnesium transporter MgtE n=1 Tax=Clostridium magnum DSM 2767 TaxID=1121326 RepID=A0A161X7M7_9CLOT|nr:CBS domain-containing protein [Clostridium magnum]KZL90136.1 magnesium transporter MgtE [Clostridium magnum DSM 2767]SHH61858.1 PRC-barrel domain-containing protein [Clostridium magnum DSM 2767]
MKKLSGFFLSKVLHRKIYDEFNESIGKLCDIYVTTEGGMPRAIGYQVKKDGELINCEFKHISFYEDDEKIIIKGEGVREIILQKYSYLLSKHLLDRQIVDINGKKLVRVNDLRIAEIAGEFRVVAVDTGVLALGRRLGAEYLVKNLYKLFNKKPADSLIVWDNVESLEMLNDNLKLSIPYKKLSKLHPADLADILEDMDINYRKKVLESIDQNLAADILEEIEPDIQADILENLSQAKRDELLDNMPNDEIADILDEVDEETAEKILLNMEKEDADEVRSLMKYEEETVGSIMNKDFIAFNISITVGETIELLRETKPEDEVSHYIYITDKQERLQGVVSLKDLLLSNHQSKLREIMNSNITMINDNENIDEAIEVCVKYDLLSLPVVDDEEKLCGIVIMNDIVEEILIPTWRKRFKKVG